jgi:hypothetical protein
MALEGNHQSYIEVVIHHRQVNPPGVGGRETSAPASRNGSTVMPRFYFHIDDDLTHIDHVGVELPDLQAARDEAVSAAGQILRNGAAKNLWSGKPWRMWVTQSRFANEKPLFVLRFSATNE